MNERKPPDGFVPLKALSGRPATGAEALAEIRQIYFRTSRRTIDHDFAHAVELLKSLPDEEVRARAHVYMEGLAEMAREWGRASGQSERSEIRKSGKSTRGRNPKNVKP